MSVSYIPETVKIRLWGKSAGRCQYEGCNEALYFDDITKVEFNLSYIAHIYADSPRGPRYDPVYSPKLKQDISNLMLLCDKHHRLIDKQQVHEHPVERLMAMKKSHEERMSGLTSLTPLTQSHIVLFGANIGHQNAPLRFHEAAQAMLPARHPAHVSAIELGLINSVIEDDSKTYWDMEDEQLKTAFKQKIIPIKIGAVSQHFSVFGLAPIPLLIRLGTLFSDISDVEVFQRHREPSTWRWPEAEVCTDSNLEIIITPPENLYGTPCLNISLSGRISSERIMSVIGETCSIWTVTISQPNNDFLKSKKELKNIRAAFRRLFDEVKFKHGQNTILHVFPAIPASVAIEFGRVWMPKADLPMLIYDQSKIQNKFIPTLNF